MSQSNHSYTVGWVCAIRIEFEAAQAFLDEIHPHTRPGLAHDTNNYVCGRIGKHNVVLVCLPDGDYGLASAASVARAMWNSFPNINIGLMVGVAGGAPSKRNDVRLGDVVVSTPVGKLGGVFAFDMGIALQGQPFKPTSHLSPPPNHLLQAVKELQSTYRKHGHQLDSNVKNVLSRNARLAREATRPHPSTDLLFTSKTVHQADGNASCARTCGSNPSSLVLRHERSPKEPNPAIHYGLIASSNRLMKNALVRDKLAKDYDVLCFEMEGAGLIDHFPCLVIRGICDYSDSHKNKEWQGYAAMVAAAYAKDILSVVRA